MSLDSSPTVVVIGFAEALAAPETVWSLVDAGCTVVAFGREGTPSALGHSRYVQVRAIPAPERDLPGSQSALIELLERVRESSKSAQHVLLPLDDTALWLCAHAELPAGWTVAGPTQGAALELALDKRRQIDAARAAGLQVPPTRLAETLADLASAPDFPLILRAADATRQSGQRLRKGGCWICCDEAELAAARAAWGGDGTLLIQPYLEGHGEGVFGLATDAGVVSWSAHRRLRMMNPHGSGSSACVSRGVDDALKPAMTRFLDSARWRGMFMIEFLRAPDGGLVFVEFNGRAWGSMALARRQGLEYPAWSVRQTLGHTLAPAAVLREGLVCRNLGRELMHLLFVLRGRRSRAVRAWPSLISALRGVLRFQRGSSFYNWRRGDWRVFASDCYYTVMRNLRKSG